MSHPPPLSLLASQASPPDASVLLIGLVGVIIVLVLDIYCMNYSLNDLNRRASMPPGNRQMWTFIIIVGGPLGQAAYWLYGLGPY
jgi:hypothetical protein